MMMVNVDKEMKQVERCDNVKFTIQENRNTSEDIIEWMNEDIEDYAYYSVCESYIWN